jgi:ABC-type lipoprotein release transport system permease subunit
MDFLLAWRNLFRQPRRTWLTTGAIAFSNLILVFLLSLQLGMYQMMIDGGLRPFTGHLQVQHADYLDGQKLRQTVPDAIALAADLRVALDLESVSPRAAGFALASSEERSYGVQILGVDPRFEPQVSSVPGLVKQGRYLESHDAAEVVIGDLLARNLKTEVGDELTFLGSGRDGSFAAGVATIVGIFRSGIPEMDRGAVEIPLGYFQDTFAMETSGNSVVVAAPSLFQVADLQTRASAILPAEHELVVRDWDELQPGLKQAIQTDLGSAMFMYAVLVVLVAFSVLNTQLMSVLERTREFGVVMALGVSPKRLSRWVLLEATMMGLMGAVLGMLAGLALLAFFMRVGISFPGLEEMTAQYNLPSRIYPQFSWIGLFAGPTFVLLGSVLAALLPAARLRRLEPVEAMRST